MLSKKTAVRRAPPVLRTAHRAPRTRAKRAVSQESLRQVIESISGELALRPLLTRIVRRACALIGADHGSIGLYDEAQDLIRIAAIHRMPRSELGAELGPGDGLAGLVLKTRKPVLLDRYGKVPNPVRPKLVGNAIIGLPIVWRRKLVGFFGIGSPPPRRFSRADVAALSLFARHAAIAIVNARRFELEQRRAERLALIARIGRIVSADLGLDDMLQKAADAIHGLLGYANVDIPLIDPADPKTLIVSVRGGGYKRAIFREDRLPVAQGIMGAAARLRRVQKVNDVARDPRYIKPPGGVAVRAELAIPILLGKKVLGVLNVESSAPFGGEDVSSLQIIADHLAVAIHNARLFARAGQAAVLEERQRLARDLHDSVTQMLFSLTLIAQTVEPAFARDVTEGRKSVDRLLELSQRAHAEMRALLAELHPPETARESDPAPPPGIAKVRQTGLAPALRELVRESYADGRSAAFASAGYRPQSIAVEESLYRLAQEALNNVAKHARASRVQVELTLNRGQVRLTVTDNGVGVHPPRGKRKSGGLGLVGMGERVKALRGELRVGPARESGTVVSVSVPRRDR